MIKLAPKVSAKYSDEYYDYFGNFYGKLWLRLYGLAFELVSSWPIFVKIKQAMGLFG